MSLILLLSICVRFVAIGYSILLQLRFKDWRIAFLSVMIALMAFRQTLTLYLNFEGWYVKPVAGLSEIPGLLVSFMALIVVHLAKDVFAEARERNQSSTHFSKAVVSIATTGAVIRGELEEAYKAVLKIVSETLDVERVSIWRFNDDRNELECMSLYTLSENTYTGPASLPVEQFPEYIRALDTLRVLDAHDAETDIRTSEFRDGYLRPNRIRSMLDAPIRVHGKLWGVVCHENVGKKRYWRTDERSFAATVGDQIAHAILSNEHNESLNHEYELERQLLQSQKMESLGTLAGGIAHDFNNILQAILGHCSMIETIDQKLPPDVMESIAEIEKSGLRAADLVRQILTFSRKSEGIRVQVDLEQLLIEFSDFARSLLPPSISIDSRIDLNGGRISADPTQLQQIFSNLCTNAHHAMEENGGTLSIRAKRIRLDEPQDSRSGQIDIGDYAEITFEDTGTGMEKDLLDKVFEPFFTTKEVGKGTGLGLAVVHGLICNLEGGLFLESHPGQGTRFTILFPLIDDASIVPLGRPKLDSAQAGKGCILIVDDEETIGKLMVSGLDALGYQATAFRSVEQCMALTPSELEQFDAAVLDYMMPGMNGIELATDLTQRRPNLPIILMSGHIDAGSIPIAEECGVRFVINKPFTVKALSDRLQQLLGDSASLTP